MINTKRNAPSRARGMPFSHPKALEQMHAGPSITGPGADFQYGVYALNNCNVSLYNSPTFAAAPVFQDFQGRESSAGPGEVVAARA